MKIIPGLPFFLNSNSICSMISVSIERVGETKMWIHDYSGSMRYRDTEVFDFAKWERRKRWEEIATRAILNAHRRFIATQQKGK